jgi:ribosome-binding protein aMBF1 (putative translation factor)
LKKDKMIRKSGTKSKKTKTAYTLDAVDEKLGLVKDREQVVREFAGWLSHEEAQELRKAVETFNKVEEGDWG